MNNPFFPFLFGILIAQAPLILAGQFSLPISIQNRLNICEYNNNFFCTAQLLDSLIMEYYNNGDHDPVFQCLRIKSGYANKMDKMREYYIIYEQIDSLFKTSNLNLSGSYIHYVNLWNMINLGNYYSKIGALELSKATFRNHLKILDVDSLKLYQYYSNDHLHLGNINKNQGNYHLALGHLNKSLMYADSFESSASYRGLIHKHFGDTYKELDNLVESKKHYDISLNLFSNANQSIDTNRIINTCNAYSDLHLKLEDVEQSLSILRRALSYQVPNDPFRTETYRAMAEAYTQAGEFAKAEHYFALAFAHDNYQERNYQTARTYLARGNMYKKQKQYWKAIDDYHSAMNQLTTASSFSGDCSLPSVQATSVYDKKTLLLILYHLAEAHYALRDEGSLYCAWEAADKGLDLVDFIRAGYVGDYDKQYLMEESYGLFEKAIEINYALHQLQEKDTFYLNYAFNVSERSKDLLLLQAFRDTQMPDYDVNPKMIEEEKILKYEIKYITEYLRESEVDNFQKEKYRDQLLQKQEAWLGLIEKIKRDHPKYYRAKFNITTATVASTKARLNPGNGLIEYFVGDDSTWIFYLQPEMDMKVYTLPVSNDSLAKVVEGMLHSIYLPNYEGEDEMLIEKKKQMLDKKPDALYAQYAHQLYQWLIGPIRIDYPEMCRHLTIIPDNTLNLLPFDALLMNAVPEEEHGYYSNMGYDFLVKDFTLNYCSSESLLQEMEENENGKRTTTKSELLAFNGIGFENEIQDIQNEFSLFSIFHWFVHPLWERSNKQELENIGTNYRYHHYAVHGILNNDSPSLSHFVLQGDSDSTKTKDKLYLHDLYRLSLQQDMVVTSACNAGVGQIRRGQGVLSMARGFSYSGTRSLITTLWEVYDGNNAEIIKIFYRNLRRGIRKDKALADAKKAYILNQSIDDKSAHPYYWSSCIAIGSMESIQSGYILNHRVLLLLICSIFVVALMIIRRFYF